MNQNKQLKVTLMNKVMENESQLKSGIFLTIPFTYDEVEFEMGVQWCEGLIDDEGKTIGPEFRGDIMYDNETRVSEVYSKRYNLDKLVDSSIDSFIEGLKDL